MDFFTDEQIRQLIKERNLKTAADVQNMLKEMFGKTLQQMLEAELENELGYSKYNVKKHRRDVSGIEEQIISMYAKGMTVRDIQDHLHNIYGIEASPTLISNITD
ncbi:transposase, partial [Thermincola ferriacetica]